MFTSEAVHRQDGRANERRSCRRATLQWVVLVFFGQEHWGKLIDLSERGMCFQFEHPPSLQEPINFTFEAMGCMTIPREGQEGKVFGDSIQATGRVIWARDFERTAGVQFLNLSTKSRDLIRYWISSGSTQDTTVAGGESNAWEKVWSHEADRKAPRPSTPAQFTPKPFAPSEPDAPFAEALSESPTETFESDLENPESDMDVVWEPEHSAAPEIIDEPATPHRKWPREPEPELGFTATSLEEPLTSEAAWPAESEPDAEAEFLPPRLTEPAPSRRKWPVEPEREPALAPEGLGPVAANRESFWEPKPALSAQGTESLGLGMLPREERQKLGQTLELKQRKARVGFVAILSFLATIGAVAGIIRFTSNFNERAEGSESVSRPLNSNATSGRADAAGAAEGTSPFLVEVLDASNQRSVLMFSGGLRPSKPAALPQDSPLPDLAENLAQAPKEEKVIAKPKREPFRDFTLVAPHASGSGMAPAASSASLDAPALPTEVPVSADLSLRTSLPTPAAPAGDRPLPVGGDVQPARLIRAMLPSYPQIARANHVAGQVTMDALVDESGSVRDVKVISGPLVLREAAKDALRQWKYEPARLDGRATAMHLTVTVKFQDNQEKR